MKFFSNIKLLGRSLETAENNGQVLLSWGGVGMGGWWGEGGGLFPLSLQLASSFTLASQNVPDAHTGPQYFYP